MATIETVSGPVDEEQLGLTLSHEHIRSTSEGARATFPHLYDEQAELERAVEGFKAVMEQGVRTIVEPTCMDLGRDVGLAQRVVDATGIQLVMCTGIYGSRYTFLPQCFANRDADYLADKLLKLRVFYDEAGKFNLSATQVGAAFLVISQFTLFADARGQNRPSFLHAARPEQGRPLLERFIARLRASGLPVETGSFGAQMAVELVNDGPVTIVLSTDAWDPRIG